MNVTMLTGEVVDRPELRTTQTGKSVMNLRLKVVEKWKTGESTSYRTVVLWERLAEELRGIQEGALVFVSGRLADRKYTTRDGEEKWVTEIRANEVEVLGADPQQEYTGGGMQDVEDRDNIPF